MKVDLIMLIAGSFVAAMNPGGQGLLGYGISVYNPVCAYACGNVVSLYELGCSTAMHGGTGRYSNQKFTTSDDCYATDDNFLRSAAYCINTHCFDITLPDLEHYWANFLIGREPGKTAPKEPYSVALSHVDPPPQIVVVPYSVLNQTTLVAEQEYSDEYDHVSSSQHVEIKQSEFGVANRAAALSLANLALLVLYAGRNNILLFITNWSFSTFLLLHRWVAMICTIEACIHASIYLKEYVDFGAFATESKKTYWIWGALAVLSMSILLPTSFLPLRQKFYNIFVTFHFVFAFVALIGCYHHVYYRYMNHRGYETWTYIAFSFWAFDRLMRFVLIARNGVRKAKITNLDEDYVRVDIPDIAAQGHAYLYFPTLTWLVWENHPFSVFGTMMIRETERESSATASGEDTRTPSSDMEKAPAHASTTATSVDPGHSISPQTKSGSFKKGLTFFVRTSGKGFTATLRTKTMLPVLVEASYAATSLDEIRSIPNCILIAGGVGISAVVPVLRARNGRVRLFWGARSKSLVEAVETSLGTDILVPSVIGEIVVGRRLNLREILEREVVGDGEAAVVVCGPGSMADEVRAIVSVLGRKGRVVKLFDEAFSW
ncbi:putative rerric reductase like transmembrane component [Daldinia sp. FL1419]|nr:putative rerric reductase like transmembrane component [Daldinia sp. FL1419]